MNKKVVLKDGKEIEIIQFQPPAEKDISRQLIKLLREIFPEEDFSLEDALAGRFKQTLKVSFFTGWLKKKLIGNVALLRSKRRIDLGVLAEVATHPECRGLGIASYLLKCSLDFFDATGGKIAYLGTSNPIAKKVYEGIGFQALAGAVMVYGRENHQAYLKKYFQPGQDVRLRLSSWGDLPGIALLFACPHPWVVVDYQRRIFSSKFIPPARCVSNFTSIYYDIKKRGGAMYILEGKNGQILGVASVIVDESASSLGVVEFFAAENYQKYAVDLLRKIINYQKLKLKERVGYASENDTVRTKIFLNSGFELAEVEKEPLVINSAKERILKFSHQIS